MATSGNVSVVSLNGSNNTTWKVQCKMALLKEGLWNCVSGAQTEPASDTEGALHKYRQKRDRALAILVLAVDPALLYL